jgi:hypothetical protein
MVGNIPTTWSVAGTGDFNGDGMGDILWQDASGNLAVWLMNGAMVTASAGIGNVPRATWSVVGTGDFNGDGKTDLLWRDGSGNTAMWFMNGTVVSSAAPVGNVSTTWAVAGTGDFNGDGMSDIVWRDNSANTAVWLMNGAKIVTAGGLGNVPAWSIVQTGDYNGDGKSDLLWRDSAGNTAIWFMNGVTVSSTTDHVDRAIGQCGVSDSELTHSRMLPSVIGSPVGDRGCLVIALSRRQTRSRRASDELARPTLATAAARQGTSAGKLFAPGATVALVRRQ